MQRKTMSVLEAAALLGIGKNSAYEAARKGEIPVVRIGRLIRVPIVAFNRLLETAGAPKPLA